MSKRTPIDQKRYEPWLWFLVGLFSARVLTQFIQSGFTIRFLPELEKWQGLALPFNALLVIQVIILLLLITVARRFSAGSMIPCRISGITLLTLGILYLVVMLLRIALDAVWFSQAEWITHNLTSFFHLVLAGFVFLVGHYHWRNWNTARK